MENFNFCIPTNIMFGRGQISQLKGAVEKCGTKILLVYGGQSIKKNGLYDQVKKQLEGLEFYELSGVEANPKIGSVRTGIEICRKEGVEVLLAVGGGSVIDCTKAIAAGVYYEGDAWEMIISHAEVKEALPIVAVSTLAATGSEADAGAVICNPETGEKLSLFSPLLFPKCAILDPENTYTVPAKQTAAGSFDILSHLMEQYFVPASTFLSDLLVESVMKTVIHYAPIAIREPENYEARAQLMWAGTIADNATLCNGNQLVSFSCHGIEHDLSGSFNTTHGEGLAILTPNWMRYVLSDQTKGRFAHFARAVWGVEATDDLQAAKEGITALENFIHTLYLPTTFTELGIDDSRFEELAAHAVEKEDLEYAYVPLNKEDVVAILKACL
ncbi:MAG: iron-containing alcohol dehydrogenase [Lachnospiraceae bacterium]|nr:iron-containing alcohol dehydrogenase [Lachnospiraceae bacterium]